MPPKAKKGKKGKARGTAAPAPMEEVEPVPGAAVSDGEDSEVSSASQPAPAQEKRKRKKLAAVDGDRQYPWRDEHQNTLAEFWLNHPIFYDKAQQHYKNKDMKTKLIQEFIQQNRGSGSLGGRPALSCSRA